MARIRLLVLRILRRKKGLFLTALPTMQGTSRKKRKPHEKTPALSSRFVLRFPLYFLPDVEPQTAAAPRFTIWCGMDSVHATSFQPAFDGTARFPRSRDGLLMCSDLKQPQGRG
ncbi:hypothetical protein B0T19DRAFT_34128 [Cercophora scortea]|uniref:Uncharacterized protein n=1 Tax=Cercophora scortea TaxID=314031 RepID=A0AAE0J3L4_9PEZI|nr:hypothetical protein B0T19DRAFT_34128 [Cercophora scortea]